MRDAYQRIPLMYRAQVQGRCQLQRLVPRAETQDAQIWENQWAESVPNPQDYQFSQEVQTKSYEITWRFVTNSGQDEGVIRPVIGAKGFPYYPGSSMKGAFWRTCPSQKRSRYCGVDKGGETHPGILRFHGGYPDASWIEEDLVDVVHPQQDWQLKGNGNHSAFIQISLYQPTLTFGISSKERLTPEEWEEIWQIWEQAIALGIGTRVSAGYGQVKLEGRESLISVHLKGQGLASQLISKEGEFRANMFKAVLRGHTLRLLGGVTSAEVAEKLTKQLWGGFNGRQGAIVGELGIVFDPVKLNIDDFTYTPGHNPVSMPIYTLNHGTLDILPMKKLTQSRKNNLSKLLKKLVQFSLLLGGFGKSWRRIHHDLFFPDYLEDGNKPMIGCHWELIKPNRRPYIVPVNQLSDVTTFLDSVHTMARKWVTANGEQLHPHGADWREAFNPAKVQVWGRIAEDDEDSEAVSFFHENYATDKTIKNSDLTGKMGIIGRIWHRMYPRFSETENKKLKPTREYVELLTIFPDDRQQTQDFLNYLGSCSPFQQLWKL